MRPASARFKREPPVAASPFSPLSSAMGYKDRVKQDLERWIGAGLVSPDSKAAILATIPDARRLDAATALAWVGAILLSIAVIAFVAANWDALPRIARFAMVIAAFAACAGAAAWGAARARPVLTNIALTVAALVFAAAVGLTGQIFDIAGEPRTAFYIAGAAAFALALAGRSTGAACAGVAFVALGDFTDRQWFAGVDSEAPWMLIAAPLGAYLALRWGSAALAHIGAVGVLYCFAWFAAKTEAQASVFLFLAILLGAFAAGARWLFAQERAYASVFYGWFAWGALLFFAIAGYLPWFGGEAGANAGMAHRLVWLIASGAVIALGRFDRHLMVTAIGVLSLIGAICGLLMDLGLDLLASAGVFLVCAVIALVAGLMLKRSKANA
jgi:uncharacterized membrane protein